MKKVLITLSGTGGELCGGVLPEEISMAIKAKKATIQKYGSGVEYNGEILPWDEIDNFAHAFGPSLIKAIITIVDGKKKHKIKVKEHSIVNCTWWALPRQQFHKGTNSLIITNAIQKGDFGYYYLNLEDNEDFDQNKLYVGFMTFD
jgi:hypothetical protein